MAKRKEVIHSYKQHYNYAMGKLFDVAGCPQEAVGKGSYIYDKSGKAYLDWSAGFGIFSLGHGNDCIREEIIDQLDQLAMLPPGFTHPIQQRFSTSLCGLLPDGLNRIMLTGSGSEACEYALRTVLLHQKGRKKIIAACNSYHGKTLGALCVMGQPHLRNPFGPFNAEVEFVPYGDSEVLEKVIDDDTMAVFLEPVLGGGYLEVPPAGYLKQAETLCRKHGALLVLDEVQTGFGRTGNMFAFQEEGICPDLLIISKTISGGFIPVAAVVVNESVAVNISDCENDPLHFHSSWQGSLLAAAAASASIDFIISNNIPAQAAEKGHYLKQRLCGLVQRYPGLAIDVPGKGLMLGVRLKSVLIEHAVWLQLLSRNVIGGLSTNSVSKTPVMRIFPPLTITYEEIDAGLAALESSFNALNRWPSLMLNMANKAFVFHHNIPSGLMRLGCSLFKLDLKL